VFLPQSPQAAQAAAGKATLNNDAGVVTSEALVTAAGASYTLTLGCNQVTSKSVVLATLSNGTNTQGDPSLSRVTPSDGGSVTFVVINRHATQALNGTIKIGFAVLN
jgi:hypothetical protein